MKRVLKVLAALAVLVLIKVSWVGCASVAPKRDLELRADYLVDKIEKGDAGLVPASDRFGGEWSLVTRSMTALALARLGKDPDAVRMIAEDALSQDARAFDTQAWSADALASSLASNTGHAGYLGHLGLILASERMLGSEAHAEIEEAVAFAIAIRLDRGELVETYPNETYVPDNVVLGAALALHAHATHGTQADLSGFVELLRANIDPSTGLLAFTPGGTGRGSGAGWNSYFLPMIDRAFAREQQAALEKLAVRLPLGMAAIREGNHPGDVDSGPLVFGLSPAATGFAIAGARCSGDPDLALALERTAETVGSTIPSPSGRSYALAPLVGDAILLAMRAGPPIGC